MSGIAGIANPGEQRLVEMMLGKIAHRGKAGSSIVIGKDSVLGAVWLKSSSGASPISSDHIAVWDAYDKILPNSRALITEWSPFALAADTDQGIFLARDIFGVRPLYYGYSEGGILCFASEVKALLEATRKVNEFPAGCWYKDKYGFQPFGVIDADPTLQKPPAKFGQVHLPAECRLCYHSSMPVNIGRIILILKSPCRPAMPGLRASPWQASER